MAAGTMPVASSASRKAATAHNAEEEDGDLEETINPADVLNRPKPAPPEWIELILQAVNNKRVAHWTPPVVWSELCYEYAKRQADTCAAKGKLQHGLTDTLQGRLGQCNLGPRDGPFRMNRKGIAEKIVESWYKEIDSYKFDNPGHHEKSANFEQLIWFGTTSIGIAISKDGRYVVANFYPAGPDSHLEPPGEKGRRLYFPAGDDTSGRVLDLTKQDKYRSWFKTNVLPVKDGPAPWLGGAAMERNESPCGSEKRSTSPGSPGRGKQPASPKSKEDTLKKQKGSKKGQSSKSPSRTMSRGSGKSSLSPGRKASPGPGDTRKKDGMKLMKPSSRSKSPKSASSSRGGRGKTPS